MTTYRQDRQAGMFAPLVYVKTEPHRVPQVKPHETRHRIPYEGHILVCGAHGHCGACDAPVTMDKLGRFRHLELKPAQPAKEGT